MKSLSAGIAGILWVGGLVFTMLAGALAAGESGASRARPNVLFIAVDDLNDWVGALRGHPQSRTPNMDRQGCAVQQMLLCCPCVQSLAGGIDDRAATFLDRNLSQSR